MVLLAFSSQFDLLDSHEQRVNSQLHLFQPPPFEVPFNHIPGAPMLPSGPKDVAQPWQQQWLHFYQQWQQYYLNQVSH